MKDTWFSRDLPVLDAVVQAFDDNMGMALPRVQDIAETTGLSVEDVATALNTLDRQYVKFTKLATGGDPRLWFVEQLYPPAHFAVGQWPTPANLTDRLLAELDEADAKTDDPERKGKIKQLMQTLGGPAKDLFVEITAKVISNQIGG
jgi:hypothetical protein